MARKEVLSLGLAMLVSGISLSVRGKESHASRDLPGGDISINVAQRHVHPGQRTSYDVVVDTRDIPLEVVNTVTFAYGPQDLPPIIILPMTHTIFSSDTDTNGVYTEGIFQPYQVWNGNVISDGPAQSDVGTEDVSEGAVNIEGPVTRFYCDIGTSSVFSFGTSYDVNIVSASLFANPESDLFIPTIQGNSNTSNRMVLVESPYRAAECTTGPGKIISSPKCSPYDRDGDGDVDLRDRAKGQLDYSFGQ